MSESASSAASLNIGLLKRLREAAGEYVPIDELARGLAGPAGAPPSPDRGRVHADLDALASFGFAIERHPYRGAAYIGPAERLCPDQIEHELGTRSGRAADRGLESRGQHERPGGGGVRLALERRPGRPGRRADGRPGPPRPVVDRPAAVVDPDVGPALPARTLDRPGPDAGPDVAWLTAMGAVATAEVVSAWIGREAAIKWPNDVRVDGRKIAGILVERPASQGLAASTAAATDGDRPGPPDEPGPAAVIGIGLNVNLDVDDLPRRSAGPGDLDPDRARRTARGSLRGRPRPDPTTRPLVRGRPLAGAAPH